MGGQCLLAIVGKGGVADSGLEFQQNGYRRPHRQRSAANITVPTNGTTAVVSLDSLDSTGSTDSTPAPTPPMAVAVRDDGGRKSVRWRELVLHGLCGDDLARVDAGGGGQGRSFELLSFGGGYQGQLGVGKAKAANRAAQVEFPEGEEPRHVACGGSFSAAVTGAGRVYTWGSNKHGQLGYKLAGVGGQQPLPAQVDGALAAVQVMAIACGREHALALSFDGGLYSWGSGKHGQLGHGDHHSHQEPRKLAAPELSFSRIATGDQHSAALSRDGKLYTWGHGGWGELGHGEPPLRGPELLEELRPKRVEAIADVACAALTCGPQQTAVISRLGQVFLCGSVGRHAAEPGSLAADSFLFTPQRLELGPEAGPAQQVALGKSHILLLDRAGDVYSVGSGAHGQLGHGSKGDLATPQLVLRGKKIVHIAAVSTEHGHLQTTALAGLRFHTEWRRVAGAVSLDGDHGARFRVLLGLGRARPALPRRGQRRDHPAASGRLAAPRGPLHGLCGLPHRRAVHGAARPPRPAVA